ncbi:hypothetical protein DL96DRAFT_1739913 [Flagelloscypha sp. PMI_526]|nr:hypothetical protein DL96DRAFT_1739913 [Flagelloscypha sp. PMI_526]
MRTLATLSCILPAFFYVAAAASIHHRDVETMAQPIPVSGIGCLFPDPLGKCSHRPDVSPGFEDGGFEANPSVSPWEYSVCARHGDANSNYGPHSGSHYGVLYTGKYDYECVLNRRVKLSRGAEYELTFYERVLLDQKPESACGYVVIIGGRTIWHAASSNSDSAYKKQTTRFIWDDVMEYFQFRVYCFVDSSWLIDDVSLTEISPLKNS